MSRRPAKPSRNSSTKPRRGWRERLSGSGFAKGLSSLFSRNPPLSDELLDELEFTLLSADVGVGATTELIDDLRRRMHKREFADAAALRMALRERLVLVNHLRARHGVDRRIVDGVHGEVGGRRARHESSHQRCGNELSVHPLPPKK